MRSLCIAGKFLKCFDEFKNIIENTSELGTLSTNEILAAVRDGAVTEWLRNGGEKEIEMADKLSKQALTHDKIKDHALLNLVKSIICNTIIDPLDVADFGIRIIESKYVSVDGKNRKITDGIISDFGTGVAKLSVLLKSSKAINVDVGVELRIEYKEGGVCCVMPERMDMSESDEKAYPLTFDFNIEKGLDYKLILLSGECNLASYVLVNKQMVNGHEYVDLELPSGTLWASCNIGASMPEDYGKFYAWGEIITKDDYCDGTYGVENLKKKLNLKNDVANNEWGGKWRMPSKENYEELLNNCIWEWSTQNGVNGYRIISKKNESFIFLPVAGCKWSIGWVYKNEQGMYWMSDSTNNGQAFSLLITKDQHFCIEYICCAGLSVRAVILDKKELLLKDIK